MTYCCARVYEKDRVFYDRFSTLCIQHYKKNETKYYQLGYETFGIILYGFCQWLIEDLKKEKIDRILFCSRDGFIIHEAFNLIPGHTDFKTDYIYVSRRSLRVPLLHFCHENKSKAIFATRYITIYDLLDSIGLDPTEYKNAVEMNNLSFETVIEDKDIENNKKVVDLIDAVWADVVANSEKEYINAQQYIKSLNVVDEVAIVDIGWRGSIQFYLQQMLKAMGSSVKLRGYYITLTSSMLRGQSMRGYFHNVDEDSIGCDLLRGYVGLIEMMFLKQEGSTKCYREDGFPVLTPYEYLENGKYTYEVEAVKDIQRGALDCIRDIVAENITEQFAPETAFANLERYAKHPSMKDVRMFSSFRFFNNGTVSYLTGENSLAFNLLHPREMIRDFYGSRWRIGFLKKNFKIVLPYNMLFNMIMKIKL